MPIREFKCPEGHITEKILAGSNPVRTIDCEKQLSHPDSPSTRYFCSRPAKLVDISSTGDPQFVKGVGGFYRPTK